MDCHYSPWRVMQEWQYRRQVPWGVEVHNVELRELELFVQPDGNRIPIETRYCPHGVYCDSGRRRYRRGRRGEDFDLMPPSGQVSRKTVDVVLDAANARQVSVGDLADTHE